MDYHDNDNKRTLILGGGEAAKLFIQHEKLYPKKGYFFIGFLDDCQDKSSIYGIPLLGYLNDVKEVVQRHKIEHIILAIPSLSKIKKIELLDICVELGINTEIIPDIGSIIRGEGSIQAAQKLNYADLLNREEMNINYTNLQPMFIGKTVLITGAGGSIGAELSRQVVECEPAVVLLVGHGENSIFNIFQELKMKKSKPTLIPVIADIQDYDRLREVFSLYKPDIVYHAAAHKHVPLMESNVKEAIKNNIIGTKNLVDISEQFDIERFIMISTDKAVDPTSVMGATKRIAEWIVQSRNSDYKRSIYSVVRFGNVLGSRGSAIPIFWEQIKAGRTVTVTHPEMERYFMTISEASQLVIEAGMAAEGGEVFILKMGKPQKIVDIVQKLIVLAGKSKEQINIRFIGIREGEKVKEELFGKKEQRHIQDKFAKFHCSRIEVPSFIKGVNDWNEIFNSEAETCIKDKLLKIAKNGLASKGELLK